MERLRTRFLADASRLRHTCHGFLLPLLCLSQSGRDAAEFISETRRETPELTAHTVTLERGHTRRMRCKSSRQPSEKRQSHVSFIHIQC